MATYQEPEISIGQRQVFVESSTTEFSGSHRWAVRVGEKDYYEVDGKFICDINGPLYGVADQREPRERSTLSLSGTTSKTDDEIYNFNMAWMEAAGKTANDLKTDNNEKYTVDLTQFLTDGQVDLSLLKQTHSNKWFSGPNSHKIRDHSLASAEASVGKAGAEWGIFGLEAEGPKASATAGAGHGNLGAFTEASAGRAEAKVGPARVRLEPNVNSGLGIKEGSLHVQILGFGITAGKKGAGFSTPLLGMGVGKF